MKERQEHQTQLKFERERQAESDRIAKSKKILKNCERRQRKREEEEWNLKMQELELRQRALEQQEYLTKSAIKENKLQDDKNRKQRLADKLPSWTDNDLPAYLAKF